MANVQQYTVIEGMISISVYVNILERMNGGKRAWCLAVSVCGVGEGGDVLGIGVLISGKLHFYLHIGTKGFMPCGIKWYTTSAIVL